MRRQRRQDTAVELELRRRLHAAGLRYRVHVKPLPSLRRTADIVFGPSRVAIFVDGCFWHGCERHKTIPRTNREFWEAKIGGNIQRDADTKRRLAEAGWMYVQVWEHDDPGEAARAIGEIVTGRRQDGRRV